MSYSYVRTEDGYYRVSDGEKVIGNVAKPADAEALIDEDIDRKAKAVEKANREAMLS